MKVLSVIFLNTQTNETLEFATLTKAALYLGIKRQTVRNAINSKSLVKDLYRISENK